MAEKGGQKRSGTRDGVKESLFSADSVEIEIIVSWSGEEKDGEEFKGSILTRVRLTWDGALAHLSLKGEEARNRISLLKMFANSVAGRLRPAMERHGYTKIKHLTGKIEAAVFDKIIEELQGRGYVRAADPPKYVRQARKYWRLTGKAIQRLAELPAGDGKIIPPETYE